MHFYDSKTHGTYRKSTHVVISKIEETKLKRASSFFECLKKTMNHKKCELRTQHTKLLLAAFASSHPQITPSSLELCLALARYTLLHDIESSLSYSIDSITLENVAMSLPKSTALEKWIVELAHMQVMIFRDVLSNGSVFFQTDGGHESQEVSLLSKYCPKQNKIIQVWAGLNSVAGKSSLQVALGAKKRLELFCPPQNNNSHVTILPKTDGICLDSGQGTPESLGAELKKLNLVTPFFASDSCGLHDLQSVFRYPVLQCIGSGGLETDNAIQLLHTTFSFFVEHKGLWKSLVDKTANCLYDEMDDLPKDMICSMQAPLITRWWSISKLSDIFTKYSEVYIKMCHMVIKRTKVIDKRNLISSNLIRMFNEKWIVADVYFLSAISHGFLNRHMKFYQGKDVHIGTNGFLSVHRLVEYFLQIRDVEIMETTWSTSTIFSFYREEYNKLSADIKRKKDHQRKYFFQLMKNQIHTNTMVDI